MGEDYKIETVNNKDYRFSENNDILSAVGMLPFLENKDFADNITVHSSLKSTNKTAKELAVAGTKHGTIIIANYQTAGKRRYRRSFVRLMRLSVANCLNHMVKRKLISISILQYWQHNACI